MVRATTAALTALLVCGMTATAGEAPKDLLGTWTRSHEDSTYQFAFKDKTIIFTSEGPLGKLMLEADYQVVEGKYLYGRVRKVLEGSGPNAGDVLGFTVGFKGGNLVISDWRGSGIVGLAGYLQGTYKGAAKK